MIDLQRYYMLLAISAKEMHGVGVQEQVLHDSRSTLNMRYNVVYRLLHDLECRQYIEPAGAQAGLGGPGGLRQLYRLTKTGRGVLQAQSANLGDTARLAKMRLP